MNSRLAIRQDLLSKSLDDTRFVRPERIESVEDKQRGPCIKRGARELAAALDETAELRWYVDGANLVPHEWDGRRRDQLRQPRLAGPLDTQQPQRVHHHQ